MQNEEKLQITPEPVTLVGIMATAPSQDPFAEDETTLEPAPEKPLESPIEATEKTVPERPDKSQKPTESLRGARIGGAYIRVGANGKKYLAGFLEKLPQTADGKIWFLGFTNEKTDANSTKPDISFYINTAKMKQDVLDGL